MAVKNKNKLVMVYCAAGLVALVILGLVIWLVVSLLGFDKSKKPPRVHQITLVKPPPPPPPQEKPPEPEIEEEIEKPPEEAPEEAADSTEEAGSDLGVDAEGGAGGDAFGLVGKKGGKALIGGESDASLLRKFAWYNSIIQRELSDKVRGLLEGEDGLPEGELKSFVRIMLDEQGNIVDFKLVKTSGNERLDNAVLRVLESYRVSEAPPPGMPLLADIRVNSQG